MKRIKLAHRLAQAYRLGLTLIMASILLLPPGGTALADDLPPSLAASEDPSATYIEDEAAVTVDANMTVSDPDGGTIAGAKVSITGNFVSAEDRLDYVTTSGIEGTYDQTKGILTLVTKSGSGTAADYQAAFRAIQYRNTSQNPSAAQRTITFVLGGNSDYLPETGHYYTFISYPNVKWSVAKADAETKTLFGMKGYMATITSKGENDYIITKLKNGSGYITGWVGASDFEFNGEAATVCEGKWRWVTGPEGLMNPGAQCTSGVNGAFGSGTPFWRGSGSGSVVNPPEGTGYANWGSGEPNNSNHEDFLHVRKDSPYMWNDLADGGSGCPGTGSYCPQGYIVEFGDMPGDPVFGNLTASRMVNVAGVNDAPTNVVLSNTSVIRGQVPGVVVGTLTATDVDSATFTYSLTTNPGGYFQIVDNQLQTTASLPDVAASYGIQIQTTDSGGLSLASPKSFTITVADPPQDQVPPTISSISDKTTNEDTVTSAIPFTITDANNDIQSVTAISNNQTIVPNNRITLGGTGSNRTITINPAANQWTYRANPETINDPVVITIIVRDRYFTTVRTFNLTVNEVNDPPTISSVPTKSTNEDTPKTVDLTITDVDGDTLTLSGTSTDIGIVPDENITFNGSGDTRTSTITPAANQSGTVNITLNVSDGRGGSASTTFTLFISAVNDAPTDISLDNSSIPEGSPINTLVGNLSSTDPDSTTFTYTFIDGANDNAYFTIAGSQLKTNYASFDREVKSVYTVQIRSTDNGTPGLTFDKSLTITISDVNETPTNIILSNNTIQEHNPADTVIGDLSTTDPDSGQTFTYTLVTNPDDKFKIVGSQLQTNAVLEYEDNTSYAIRIRTTDNGAPTNLSFEKDFTIIITDANDAPTDISLSDNKVEEHPGSGVQIGILSTTDADAGQAFTYELVSGEGSDDNSSFAIVDNQLQTALDDYDPMKTYYIRVRTTDNGSPALSYEKNFIIQISANLPPTITGLPENLTVLEDENTGAIAFTVGDSETPVADLVLSKESSDLSIVPLNNIVFGGSGANRTVAITPLPNKNGIVTISINVSDGFRSTVKTLTLTVTAVNDAPTGLAIDASSVPENSDVGTVVGNLSSTDLDSSSFTYSLVTNPGDKFKIEGNQLQTNGSLNYETQNSYTIRVKTTDDGVPPMSFEKDIVISITNVNEAPQITNLTSSATTNEDTQKAVTFNVSDPEGDSLTVRASSSDTLLIPNSNITSSGTGLNRTATITPAANLHGAAVITISASDGPFTVTQTFDLTVASINDAPVVSAIPNQSTNRDTPSNPIYFTIADVDNDIDSLVITATSSIPDIVDNGDIIISGYGGERSMIIFPMPEASGSTNITVNVSDGVANTQRTFQLNVTDYNDPPTITAGQRIITLEDTPSDPFPFTIEDADGEVQDLIITTYSSNTALAPRSSLSMAGAGNNRTLTVTPLENKSGVGTITITVRDNYDQSDIDIDLVVIPVNDAPVISKNTGSAIKPSETLPITSAMLNTVDVDNTAAEITYVISAVPDHGTLLLNGSPVVLDGTFTQTDINSGRLAYQQTDPTNTNDSFGFTVHDPALAEPPDVNPTFTLRGTVVTRADDAGDPGSLRYAINSAASGDTITFDEDLAGAIITLGSPININKNLTISGAGLRGLTINGSNNARLFNIAAETTARFSNLTFTGGSADNGGAISNQGNLTVTGSTFAGNNATAAGGAIFNQGTLNLTNCTFSGNAAATNGGAIENQGTLTSNSVTFALNSAPTGGGISASSGVATLINTLLAGNTPADCAGAITSNGHNLSQNPGTCTFNADSDITGVNPNLAALADNGGDSQTHALPFRSPAIDSGVCSIGSNSKDQRDLTRPQGPACDIGAYEYPVDMEVIYDDIASEITFTNASSLPKYQWYRDEAKGIHISPYLKNSATFKFYGDRLAVRFWTGSTYGTMDIVVDGVRRVRLNQKGKTAQQEWSISNLGSSMHTLTLIHIKGKMVNLDSITVRQTAPVISLGKVPPTDVKIAYSGVWSNDGIRTNSLLAKGTANITFTGNRLSLVYWTGSRYGIMEVYVDGMRQVRIDQKGRSAQQTWNISGLSDGEHTLTLKHLKGAMVNLSGITIQETPVPVSSGLVIAANDTNKIAFNSYWVLGTDLAISQLPKGTATLQFTGTGATINFLKGSKYGTMEVFVDGVKKAKIDQRRKATLPTLEISGLAAGEHTLLIKHTAGRTINFNTIEIKP